MRQTPDRTSFNRLVMHLDAQIELFLAGSPHAVVGASPNRSKYGNKVLRAYLQNGRAVYPVHPSAATVEGVPAYPNLQSLPVPVYGVSIITPSTITEQIAKEALALGIQHLWMQPGAESKRAIEIVASQQVNVIGGTGCLLVTLGFQELEETS